MENITISQFRKAAETMRNENLELSGKDGGSGKIKKRGKLARLLHGKKYTQNASAKSPEQAKRQEAAAVALMDRLRGPVRSSPLFKRVAESKKEGLSGAAALALIEEHEAFVENSKALSQNLMAPYLNPTHHPQSKNTEDANASKNPDAELYDYLDTALKKNNLAGGIAALKSSEKACLNRVFNKLIACSIEQSMWSSGSFENGELGTGDMRSLAQDVAKGLGPIAANPKKLEQFETSLQQSEKNVAAFMSSAVQHDPHADATQRSVKLSEDWIDCQKQINALASPKSKQGHDPVLLSIVENAVGHGAARRLNAEGNLDVVHQFAHELATESSPLHRLANVGNQIASRYDEHTEIGFHPAMQQAYSAFAPGKRLLNLLPYSSEVMQREDISIPAEKASASLEDKALSGRDTQDMAIEKAIGSKLGKMAYEDFVKNQGLASGIRADLASNEARLLQERAELSDPQSKNYNPEKLAELDRAIESLQLRKTNLPETDV